VRVTHRDETGELREQVRQKDAQIETFSKLNQDLQREIRYSVHASLLQTDTTRHEIVIMLTTTTAA